MFRDAWELRFSLELLEGDAQVSGFAVTSPKKAQCKPTPLEACTSVPKSCFFAPSKSAFRLVLPLEACDLLC